MFLELDIHRRYERVGVGAFICLLHQQKKFKKWFGATVSRRHHAYVRVIIILLSMAVFKKEL